MKKNYKVSVAVLLFTLLASVGAVWGDQEICRVHVKEYMHKNSGLCTWTEEASVNKLVRGRAGQLSWVLMPTYRVRTAKCADATQNLN